MATAADIARETVLAATPDAPPLIREITRAVFDGSKRIRAEVIDPRRREWRGGELGDAPQLVLSHSIATEIARLLAKENG